MLAAFLSPDAFPQVTVSGEPYEMRLSLRSKIFLEKRYKIPADKLSKWLTDQYDTECFTSCMMIMAGAMLGRVANGKWVAMPVDDEKLADSLTEEEFRTISRSYIEALEKVAAGIRQALESLPKMSPKPEPEQVDAQVVN